MTKRFFSACCLALGLLSGAHAAGGGVALDKFPAERVTNLAALQNGAKLFVNYCLNCHSASFMRYNRMRDIGLTDEQIKNNLMFAAKKVGDPMTITLDPVQAKEWFGAPPPDLTVVARSRSGAGGQRRRLPLHLPAHLLPRRHQGHGLEQPGLPECGHAACAVGTAGPAARRVRRREGPARPGQDAARASRASSRSRAGTLNHCGVQRGGGRPGGLHAVDGRAAPEPARAPRRVGAAVPGRVHRDRVAAECRVTGKTSSSVRMRRGRRPGCASAAGRERPLRMNPFCRDRLVAR